MYVEFAQVLPLLLQVGIIPTDTFPALVVDLLNRDAVLKLYNAKELDPKRPLSILCKYATRRVTVRRVPAVCLRLCLSIEQTCQGVGPLRLLSIICEVECTARVLKALSELSKIASSRKCATPA